MKLLIVAAVLMVGVVMTSADASADDAAAPQKCTLLERVKVNRQWNHAYGEGQHRLDFVVEVFKKYLYLNPKARETIFKEHRGDNIYSAEFQAHGHRILAALGLLINTADEPETLKAIFGRIKSNENIVGTEEVNLESFQATLMSVIPHHIGNHFDWDAWTDCLSLIFNAIKH